MSQRLIHLIRWQEWYDSKLPLMAAAVYHLALQYPRAWSDAILRYVLLLGFCGLFLAYGYALNDYSDIEVDKRAGKRKAMAEMSQRQAISLLFILATLGSLILCPYYRNVQVLLAVALCYVFGTAYSLPPVRLKERGVAGLLGSAIAQRTLPVLVIGAVWGGVNTTTLGWAFLGFLVGMRYILIHQQQDMVADVQSHVSTFATQHPAMIVRLIYLTFILEIIVLGGLTLFIIRAAPLFWLLPLGYSLYSIGYYMLYRRFIGLPSLTSFAHVPLADLYLLFLPLTLLLFLIGEDAKWLLLLPLEISWKKQGVRQYLSLPYRYGVSLWQTYTASLRRKK